MIKSKKWVVMDCNKEKAIEISQKYNISPLIASVILNRGITDDEVENYISKDSSQFCDPFLLTDMKKAVDFINEAISKNTKIAVYGDYDVDGITSTYIVYDYLKSKGADIIYYIPDRADEGYGVNKSAISSLKNQGIGLIITVDVGITAVEETEFAKENGIDIIITDHHTPKEILPDAVAVVNPKTPENKYPNTELAGVGVAYKLVYALSECDKEIMKKYSEAAAIGTIADMVPLKGENRFIASYGIDNLKSTQNTGLSALMEVAGIDKTQLVSANISFGLAPRLNAAGRIASAGISVDLFLEKDKEKAFKIATCLDDDNKTRQAEEHMILEEAEAIIKRDKLYDDNVIVVANKGWHHGVIGIVSSKITEKYYKPSTVISINDDGSAKASGRSIAGFNIFDALSACEETLTKYGGHDLAAGFSLEEKDIDLFRKKINEYSKGIMTEEILTPKLTIDAIISPEDISCSTASEISILEPFGIGNKTPVFCIEDTSVSSVRLHKSGKHTFLTLEKNKIKFDAPAFNMPETTGSLTPGEKISAAGMININNFRGIDNIQFVIKDIKSSDKTSIDQNNLRGLFVCIKNYVNKNTFKFKISDLREKLFDMGFNLGITKIKTALNIFKELELVKSSIDGDVITITRDKNFYSKCNLEDSKIYLEEIKLNDRK
ncbi:MAG: single-stranded-DNA-specific exonuclease RecJ [Clostridia bacterium]|nr:single-stranded-DNA-specific exonuclease RecJ [Clostridia bacterium]